MLLGLATCCISAFIGLAIKDEESVQAFGLIWVFPLTFVSSAFVPTQTMPGWMQAFANNQPITQIVDAMRALALGQPVGNHVWLGIVWMIGVMAVFIPLAVRSYRKA
jgi:ABC-type multidrug transport system permease subunit